MSKKARKQSKQIRDDRAALGWEEATNARCTKLEQAACMINSMLHYLETGEYIEFVPKAL